jgi:hypothetical protein
VYANGSRSCPEPLQFRSVETTWYIETTWYAAERQVAIARVVTIVSSAFMGRGYIE